LSPWRAQFGGSNGVLVGFQVGQHSRIAAFRLDS